MRFENPVLNRELIENLRSPRAFALQALFVAVLGGIVVFAWPSEMNLLKREQRSIQIYDVFANGQLVLLALLAPILSAPAIASERERKSLDLLLTSPLKPSAIVWGKLLSAVTYLLLLAISSLPIFSLCFQLGGIAELEVLATYLILITGGIACGSIGLAASVWMGRSRAALSVSYVIILPILLVVVLANPMRSFAAAVALALVAGACSLVLLILVTRRLGMPFDTAPRAADDEDKNEQVGLVLDRKKFPDSLLSPRGSGQPIEETVNPLYEKELRFELFGRGTLLVRLLLQVSLVAALPFFIAALSLSMMWLYTYYVLAFVMLLAPSLSAGLFTQERERGTFDLLLTTGLTHRDILRAKLGISLRTIGILAGFMMPFLVLLWVIPTEIHDRMGGLANAILAPLLVITSTALFVVMLTAFISMISRTTLRSMVYTYLTIGLLFVTPAVMYVVMTTIGQANNNLLDLVHEWQWVGASSPFYVLARFEGQIQALGMYFTDVRSARAGDEWKHLIVYTGSCLVASMGFWIAMRLLFNRYCQLRHDRGL